MAFFNLPNFDQNFLSSRFFCNSIHGLHLCYHFDAFNINVEDFIDKSSENKTSTQWTPGIQFLKIDF